MPLAAISINPEQATIKAGDVGNFALTVTGNRLATINNLDPAWTALTGCAIQPGGQVRRTVAGSGWGVSGAVSGVTIAAGDGYVDWYANVPFLGEFTNRQFFAGLTSQPSINTYSQIDFALQVVDSGVYIYEGGVVRANVRAPNQNGYYRIAIENGQVVYYADGDVIWRSTASVTYPLRFGAVFFFEEDQIDGTPQAGNGEIYWEARGQTLIDTAGFSAPNPAVTWNSPATRQRWTVTAVTASNLIVSSAIEALAEFPRIGLAVPLAGLFYEEAPEYRVEQQEYADKGADFNVSGLSADPVRRWRIEWGGGNLISLTEAQAAVLDNFYYQHVAQGYPFYFYNYRTAELVNNVRFLEYERSHLKRYRQRRRIRLIRRPL